MPCHAAPAYSELHAALPLRFVPCDMRLEARLCPPTPSTAPAAAPSPWALPPLLPTATWLRERPRRRRSRRTPLPSRRACTAAVSSAGACGRRRAYPHQQDCPPTWRALTLTAPRWPQCWAPSASARSVGWPRATGPWPRAPHLARTHTQESRIFHTHVTGDADAEQSASYIHVWRLTAERDPGTGDAASRQAVPSGHDPRGILYSQ